jgi:hypothetical protein
VTFDHLWGSKNLALFVLVVGGQVHNVISMEQGGFSVSMHMW